MICGRTLRAKRIAAGIPGDVVAARVRIDRARLSRLERNVITAHDGELNRIEAAIDELAEAKRSVENHAAEVGWPMAIAG
jgi:transcriptional regulator with XRE-family HTH domain